MKFHTAFFATLFFTMCYQSSCSAVTQFDDADSAFASMKSLFIQNQPLSARYHIVEPSKVVVNGTEQKLAKAEKLSILHCSGTANLRRVIVELEGAMSENDRLNINAESLEHNADIFLLNESYSAKVKANKTFTIASVWKPEERSTSQSNWFGYELGPVGSVQADFPIWISVSRDEATVMNFSQKEVVRDVECSMIQLKLNSDSTNDVKTEELLSLWVAKSGQCLKQVIEVKVDGSLQDVISSDYFYDDDSCVLPRTIDVTFEIPDSNTTYFAKSEMMEADFSNSINTSIFRLPHYDLPEPKWATRGIPFWMYAASAGIGSIIISLLLRGRQTRQAN